MANCKKKGTILIVTHLAPYPVDSGDKMRIYKLLTWLRDNNYELILLVGTDSHHVFVQNSLTHLADYVYANDTPVGMNWVEKLSLRRISGGISYSSENSFFSEKLIYLTRLIYERHKPSVVISEYAFFSFCFDMLPEGVLKIIDTHQVLSRKEDEIVRQYGIKGITGLAKRVEREYLLKSDIVLAIQSHEESLLKKIVPEKEVITVGIDLDSIIHKTKKPDEVSNRILFVGSDSPLNNHGINEFISHALPLIRTRMPSVELRICGRVTKNLPFTFGNVQLVGYVDDLTEEYAQAAVVINPNRAGTGLKIKSVEALCHGKPLISTPNGVEGIDFLGRSPYIVCSDWEVFSARTVELLRTRQMRLDLGERAHEFSQEKFSSSCVYKPLTEALEEHNKLA